MLQNIKQDPKTGNEFMVINGRAIPIVMRVPFIYQVPAVAALAAGATAQPVAVQIDSGCSFVWQRGVYEFDIAGAAYTYDTRPMPNYTVAINDSGSGRNLQNNPVPVGTWFGAVEKPTSLLLPYTFVGSSTITFTITNFDAAVATGVLRLSLIGQQIYFGE